MTPEIKRLRALLEESRSTACGQALAPLLGTIPALLDVAEAAAAYIDAVDAETGQATAQATLRTALAGLGVG